MVTEALPIDRVVRVNASISPSTPLRPDFGRTLLMTPSALAPARTSTYSSAVSVGRIFGTANSSVYSKALEYFGQTPYPKDLIIGRWAQATVNGRVTGGTHQTLAALRAITAGTFTISGQATTALSFCRRSQPCRCRWVVGNGATGRYQPDCLEHQHELLRWRGSVGQRWADLRSNR